MTKLQGHIIISHSFCLSLYLHTPGGIQRETHTHSIDFQRNQGQALPPSSPRALWDAASGKGNVTGFLREVSVFAMGVCMFQTNKGI